jgi:hypothetical protein
LPNTGKRSADDTGKRSNADTGKRSNADTGKRSADDRRRGRFRFGWLLIFGIYISTTSN